MARPLKKRQVCCLPKHQEFSPTKCKKNISSTSITIDEHETIRLIDLEGYTQEECAKQMGVSRTTIQGIYLSARQKIADAIINGKKLAIHGGDYEFCKREDTGCKRKNNNLCGRKASTESCQKTLKCNKHI